MAHLGHEAIPAPSCSMCGAFGDTASRARAIAGMPSPASWLSNAGSQVIPVPRWSAVSVGAVVMFAYPDIYSYDRG